MTETRKPLLIVEDDPALLKQMQWAFDGYETIVAVDRESAIAQLRRHEPAVVTMDLGLPPRPDDPTEGLALLEEVHTLAPETKVIVLTGQNDRANAVKAIALGAHDFCTKPFEPELLNWAVERAFRVHELQEENRRLMQTRQSPAMSVIDTPDPEMQRICRTIEKLAPTSATVLILGESGTGKELFARALHDLSPRQSRRFVAINCAEIPENLLESELFGYEKGAYTGAAKQTVGKIETANGGTLFLDEIGDLPVALQVKLLRFLQASSSVSVGVRRFRSTCGLSARPTRPKDQIATAASAKIFITDWQSWSRFPLRERQGDAVLLAHVFVRKFRRAAAWRDVDPADAIAAIEAHPWPGNVRELENVVKRAAIMADGLTIRAADVGLGTGDKENTALNLRLIREEAERNAVLRVLGRVNGNLSKAAELLGVSRPTLYDLMHRFGLK